MAVSVNNTVSGGASPGVGSGDVATDAIWDAAGDLVIGTGSDTATRLAIGTAGQVLTVNAGATAPEWDDPVLNSVATGGAGADRTDVTTEADPVNGGDRVLTETVDGIDSTYDYDAQGNIIVEEWVSGGLEREVDFITEPGFGIATGNIYVGETISVLSAQMATLKSALISLGTVVTKRFYVSDFDSNRGLLLEWNHVDACFRGIGRTAFKAGQRFAYDSGDAPGTSELTMGTIVVPEWLRADGAVHSLYFSGDYISEADEKVSRFRVNGTQLVQNTLTTVTHNAATMRFAVLTPTVADLRTVSNFSGYTLSTSSSAVHSTTTVTAGTDLTYTATMQHSTGGGAGTRSYGHVFSIEVHNP